MQLRTRVIMIFSALIIFSLACQSGSSTPPTETPNNQSTIDAAIAATSNAGASMQSTIDASIAGTMTVMPPTPTSGPPVEYVTMTEEELATLVDQSVQDAVATTQQTSTAATQSTSDSTVTPEELATMYDYYYAAEAAVTLAEEYLDAYYGLYADLAYETLDLLVALEEDLSAMTQSLDTLSASLEVIDDSLSQGLALAEESLDQLNTAAQNASANLAEAQAQSQEWVTKLQGERERRAQTALSVQPDNVPTDQLSALVSAFSYIDTVRNAFTDNKISRDELSQIAQLGANATAGLNTQGGAQLQGLSGKLNEITGMLARGQMPEAKNRLGEFESALGTRPSGGNLPSLPNLPGGGQPGGGGVLPRP